jgi:hypothetical protein
VEQKHPISLAKVIFSACHELSVSLTTSATEMLVETILLA